ncbi:MAG: polysaccharide export protein [Deltaproteobacteria bacterium]|nr:polysaccharide export protein [Deltaproteobacteria bacterium]
MRKGSDTAGAARCARGFLLVCVLSAAACAGRQPPPSTPVQGIEMMPEERLGIDDVFEVRVFGEPDLSGAYRIAADGTIDYPFAGRLSVVGLRSGDIQQLISTKLKDGYLKNPQVSLMVKEWNSRKVSVIGQVQNPGSVAYFTNMTIVDAIAAAGGFTGIASKNSVTLRREVKGAVESRNCAVADITEGRAPNIALQPGDILVVEERLF